MSVAESENAPGALADRELAVWVADHGDGPASLLLACPNTDLRLTTRSIMSSGMDRDSTGAAPAGRSCALRGDGGRVTSLGVYERQID